MLASGKLLEAQTIEAETKVTEEDHSSKESDQYGGLSEATS